MDNYEFIATKINALKEKHPSLRARTDDYVFSVLCVKNHFYKNPALVIDESDFAEIVVDGSGDGGADILLTDPNSETSDLVIGQSKFYKTISAETVLNAMRKMADFYADMAAGHYEQFNSRVTSRFRKLDGERGDDSKVHFVFYTSAPKKRSVDTDDIEKKFRTQFDDSSEIEVSILFADDIKREIDNAEAQRFTIERGNIRIDDKDNYLLYGDDAVIVNVSAFSIKKLYAEHGKNLLALNLRYYIRNTELDKKIRETIRDNPASFWFKNNGITIICEKFRIDGREVHLENFSIVNGGQTTYLLSKSELTAANDLYLMCKIIKIAGDLNGEFSLEIAEAANSQKPITDEDLKANSPEQRSFEQAMRAIGVFYQTKRGQKVPPKQYREAYRKTRLEEVGKLCMAAIFQMPCVSRNARKLLYRDRYYNPIFNGNQEQVAQLCKELLYIDYYFKKKFKPKFEQDNENEEDAETRIHLANKSRTICIAFTALAARYHCGNLTDEALKTIFAAATSESVSDALYKAVRDLGSMQCLLPKQLSENMDLYDAALDNLFTAIVEEGISAYSYARDSNPNLTENSFLQNDRNYYRLLKSGWNRLKKAIRKTFADV